MIYLIKFNYRCNSELFSMCKGTLLVYADTYELACDKIKAQPEYKDAQAFENLTLQ